MEEKTKNKTCGECRFFEAKEFICCHSGDEVAEHFIACLEFEPMPEPKPTVFQQITQSPEMLARKVVYPVLDYGNSIGVKIRGYKSPFLDDIYPTWNLAFEKTLAKLKEVRNG